MAREMLESPVQPAMAASSRQQTTWAVGPQPWGTASRGLDNNIVKPLKMDLNEGLKDASDTD